MRPCPAFKPLRRRLQLLGLGVSLGLAPALSQAWDMAGPKALMAHVRGSEPVRIGTVNFEPAADGKGPVRFTVTMDTARFTDHFLSMKEFKCLEGGGEVSCHVPYPYPQPGTVTAQDFSWLEHALLFLYKAPRDFGAKLWNGVYFRLQATERGLVGTPQAIDLNLISAPPERPGVPPYRPALRDDLPVGARALEKLSIE
jgi:hypothetical protein